MIFLSLDLQTSKFQEAVAQIRSFAHPHGIAHSSFVPTEFVGASEERVICEGGHQAVGLGVSVPFEVELESTLDGGCGSFDLGIVFGDLDVGSTYFWVPVQELSVNQCRDHCQFPRENLHVEQSPESGSHEPVDR